MNRSRPSVAGLSLAFASAILLPVAAQSPRDSEVPEDDATIILSPFEVSSSSDVGYLAQNTLAGSRLNTNLKDTAAAISVLTPEFLRDLGATNMRDVILFQNNAVPDLGDAAPNFNANPLVGNDSWNLRIRGLPASYARNYFAWETSTDFFNIDRVDQARGPNSILFGFGSPGGIVNSTTKQAIIGERDTEISLLAGSWDRYRGSLDYNHVLVPGKFALRLNAVAENGHAWREWEFNRERRAHLAARWQIDDHSSLRAEGEYGQIDDNVARPWLMVDQTFAWREAGSPTFDNAQWDSTIVTQTWSEHLVYTENDGSLMNWANMPFSYSADRSWSHLSLTPENLAIIPLRANAAGPGALRESEYETYSAFYENQLSDALSVELAFNHQSSDFRGYDSEAGNLTRYGYQGGATSLWADASNWLPTWSANPHAGDFYIENNWTRRYQTVDIDSLRGTAAYELDLDRWGTHHFAGLYEHTWRDYFRMEESEVLAGRPFDSAAEFDSNRLFRRNYFTPGEVATIRAPSWQNAVVNLTDPVTGRTLSSGWAPNQDIDNSDQRQNTLLAAVQSTWFDEHLVTVIGYRYDQLDYTTTPTIRDANTGLLRLDEGDEFTTDFTARTLTAGAVYHLTPRVSLFGNLSNSRALPNVDQTLIDGGIPPMPEGEGTDLGLKLDLGTKLYATASYYTTDVTNTTEWGNIYASVTTLNNRILERFVADGLIAAAERDARLLDANAYLEDRSAEGWEFSLVANPTETWRLTANFSINEVVKDNIMSEVAAWADEATAFWLQTGGAGYLLGGGDWDTIGNQIGWMTDYIDREVAFNGLPARGERKYGANLYTNYRIADGPLKGLSFGGGGRYQSPNTIGMDGDEVIKGRRLLILDASVGYEFAMPILGRRTWVDLQLNVSNVLDNDDVQVYTVAWWDPTRAERIGLPEPRRFTFTARFLF